MIEVNGKVYRNLQEQVYENTIDIDELKRMYGYRGPYESTADIENPVDLGLYLIGTEAPYAIYQYHEVSDNYTNIGIFNQRGPQGPVGPQGPQGETGAKGDPITITVNDEVYHSYMGNIDLPDYPHDGVWGSIVGTLSDQTDLQAALDAKQNKITDLDEIRTGAALGATAVQPSELDNYYDKEEIDDKLDLKADAADIPTKVSELENDENYVTAEALGTDYVTTATNQNIYATKTFKLDDDENDFVQINWDKIWLYSQEDNQDYYSSTLNATELSILKPTLTDINNYEFQLHLKTVVNDYDTVYKFPINVNGNLGASHTVATTDMLPDTSNMVTTNTEQTITKKKYFGHHTDSSYNINCTTIIPGAEGTSATDTRVALERGYSTQPSSNVLVNTNNNLDLGPDHVTLNHITYTHDLRTSELDHDAANVSLVCYGPREASGLRLTTSTTSSADSGPYGTYYKNGKIVIEQTIGGSTSDYTFDDASTGIARMSDIPDVSDFVTDTELATTLDDYELKADAFSGNYNDLTNKPDLSVYELKTDAFSGDYNDLTNKPTLFSGDYDDLTNKPTIPVVPTNVSAFTNDAGYITSSDLPTNHVTTDTAQTITGAKTFTATLDVVNTEKGIKLHSGTNNSTNSKLGFTLFNSTAGSSSNEVGFLEGNTQSKDVMLGFYNTTGRNLTDYRDWKVGFAYYGYYGYTGSASTDYSAYKLVLPNKYNLRNYSTYRYIPIDFTDGTTTVRADETGIVNLSSLIPNVSNYYTKTEVDNLIPTVPTNVSAFTNDAGYITGITSSDVTTALGYTPGTSNFSGSYTDLTDKPTIPSTASSTSTVTPSTVTLTFTYSDDTTENVTLMTGATVSTTTTLS